ncbi:hypothetical protein NZD89_01185 [Alicyclobacillus fastidiosus]|uniref:Uncharacterized protein n=1 Tax=Alicyclobacillus fastidiosus TaxID=392011 RepID=A0ABY6ZHF8_9BACL|nr:hypothetical protein [Alicyclobacillus fastidiosus]WAH42160.1 hypothetical protein NZD89_01185 [Alicyclobacillus fastidiosus]GMA63952.1 hypothetical protein GCM10025859_43920 [Alicyclobacillus fastidiosus]
MVSRTRCARGPSVIGTYSQADAPPQPVVSRFVIFQTRVVPRSVFSDVPQTQQDGEGHYQGDLYADRLPNQGTLEVFDSGKLTSIIVPGATSFTLFTSGDNVSFLKKIVSQDLPRT